MLDYILILLQHLNLLGITLRVIILTTLTLIILQGSVDAEGCFTTSTLRVVECNLNDKLNLYLKSLCIIEIEKY